MKSDTTISLAEVRSRVDPGRSGAFRARIDCLGNEEETILYSSPYGSNAEGAFIAVPEVGTTVLVCQPKNSSSWYYMGTTFLPEPGDTTGGSIPDSEIMPFERVDPEIYKARGTPLRQVFKSPNGAGITMSDEYNPSFINRKTEITSTTSKKVILHDSPNIDSIILDSGNGSRITLTDDPQNESLPSRAIQVETVGPQKYINLESQTDMVVGAAGRELQLLNNANGVQWGDSAESGNVNVQSRWKDVNVFTQAEAGKIFIECVNEEGSNQHIVIETNGTDGSIIVKTKGNIFLDAQNDINIKAGNNLNLECGNKLSMQADSLDIAGGTINIDGDPINIASDLAQPNPANVTSIPSRYGNDGITTY